MELIIKYNANLTYKEVCYAFQRLIFSLAMATSYDEYSEDKEELNNILNTVKKWFIMYNESKNLSLVSLNELEVIEKKLYDLDGKYLSSNGLYCEEAYEWILQLQILIKKAKEKEID